MGSIEALHRPLWFALEQHFPGIEILRDVKPPGTGRTLSQRMSNSRGRLSLGVPLMADPKKPATVWVLVLFPSIPSKPAPCSCPMFPASRRSNSVGVADASCRGFGPWGIGENLPGIQHPVPAKVRVPDAVIGGTQARHHGGGTRRAAIHTGVGLGSRYWFPAAA
jgi:hypothetical protein